MFLFLILNKRCLKSTLKHIIASYTNVFDGLKHVVWIARSYLPSAFAGLKPGSLRPVRFGNTFMISMAMDGEYHCHCAVCVSWHMHPNTVECFVAFSLYVNAPINPQHKNTDDIILHSGEFVYIM